MKAQREGKCAAMIQWVEQPVSKPEGTGMMKGLRQDPGGRAEG